MSLLRSLAVTIVLAVAFLIALSVVQQSFARVPAGSASLAHSAAPAPTLAAVAPRTSAGSSILGRPSLSAAFVNRVLAAYHSPAAGLGQTLYDLSVTYGIDDAYPLAFFLHESSMGNAGMAVSTHSLGNIRCTPGWACSGGYRYYATWADGFHDWFRLIAAEYLPHGLATIPTIIPVYAPSADHNDEHAYIAAVLSAVSVWRSGRLLV